MRRSHFDEFHSPILGSALLGVIVVYGLVRSEAARAQAARLEVRRDERTDNGRCASLRQFDVVVMLADIICVPVDGKRQGRIIRHEFHDLGDDRLYVGSESRFIGVEIDVQDCAAVLVELGLE